VIIYYITDRSAFPGAETQRRDRLLEKITEATRCGVNYIQLREKDLPARELESLAREALHNIRENQPTKTEKHEARTENWEPGTRLLINSRTDVALSTGADGVHLRSNDVSPKDVRQIWSQGAAGDPANPNRPADPLIAVSCHTAEEVREAAARGATFAVFAPVFEKAHSTKSATGLQALREACRAPIPVLALGGVTLDHAKSCLDAGAAGIAAIRLFQENNIADVAHHLRSL